MSAGKSFRNLALGTLVAAVFTGVSSVRVGVAPALALGTPQIVSVNPGSGAPVGSTVCIRARIDWDSEYRAMRIRFGNEGWQESSETEFERCFGTGHLSPGWYTIRVEAARLDDTSWSSPTSTETGYELTGSSPPPEPTQPPSPPRGPNVSVIDLSPSGSAEIGTQVRIHIVVDSANPGAIRTTVSCGGVQHVEHTVPEFSTTWYTETCSPGSQSVRVCARDVNDPNWANASCADRGYSLWAQPSSPRPTADLRADSESIQAGQCTTLRWTTTGASRVELDGEVVSASGQRQVCPSITKHYNLRATGDGGQADDNVSVYVTSAPPQAQVIDSFHTGDVIDIGGNIYVIVDRQRRHVPNPETLDALGIPRSWVNNRGFSASQLRTILEGPDIPDVNRDRSGFDAFKRQYFPNTSPIIPATATPKAQSGGQSGGLSLTVSPTSVAPGGTVRVSWSGYNPDGNDWVSLHPAGGPDSSYLDWKRISGSSGSVTFAAPQQPGWYEFQLYRNGPKVATSNRFHVVIVSGETAPTGADASSFAIDNWMSGSTSRPGLIPRVSAAETNPFAEGQCTYFVYSERSDVSEWIVTGADTGISGTGNAENWDDHAEDHGVSVDRGSFDDARPGDIVVWEGGCGTPSSSGHVAILVRVDGKDLVVNEANHCKWNSASQRVECDGKTYWGSVYRDVDPSCVSFVHQPSGATSSSEQGSGLSLWQIIWNWLKSKWPW